MMLSSELLSARGRREVEYTSIGQGQFVTISDHTARMTTSSASSATFRLPPAKPLAWDSERDFHADLVVPAASTSTNKSNHTTELVLTWQARAREGLVVALSSDRQYQGTQIALGVSGATFCGTDKNVLNIKSSVNILLKSY